MRIAIYTGKLPAAINEKYNRFIVETIKQLIAPHKAYEFIFLSDKPEANLSESFSNSTWTYLQAPPDNSLLLKWWLGITVPSVLKKINADLFVSSCVASSKSKIPQCLVIAGLQYVYYPELFSKTELFFFRRYMKGLIKKATSVAVPSEMIKKIVLDKYETAKQKCFVVPFSSEKKQHADTGDGNSRLVKKLAGDKLYFLATGEELITNELLILLKAFSVFKKMQQSNMKLIIAGKTSNGFSEQLNSYKYRKDVIIYLPSSTIEESELIESAYALVLPSKFDFAGINSISAMQNAVPVICASGTATEQIAGSAALYFNPEDFTELASKMMQLYKDEEARKKLIEKGGKAVSGFSTEKSAALLWHAIEKTMG